MTKTSPQDVTQLLLAWNEGDQTALEKLTVAVEAELRRLAQGYLSRERPGHTLQPTALVNEVYLRLIDWKNTRWQNKAHFSGVSAKLMRRILVDHVRRHRYLKRGGDAIKVPLEDGIAVASSPTADLVALDEALQRLADIDMRKSQIIEMRFFGGLSEEETAYALNISTRTVRREWSVAQAWLYRELSGARE